MRLFEGRLPNPKSVSSARKKDYLFKDQSLVGGHEGESGWDNSQKNQQTHFNRWPSCWIREHTKYTSPLQNIMYSPCSEVY